MWSENHCHALYALTKESHRQTCFMNLNESITAKVQSRNYIKEKYLVLNAESWI